MCDHHLVMMDTDDKGRRAVYDCNSSAEDVGFEHLSDAEVNAIVRQICGGFGIAVPEWDDSDGILYVDADDTPQDDDIPTDEYELDVESYMEGL
jgi:hypothetical protein